MSANVFSALPLRPELQTAITTLGYREPTPVQAQTLPDLLQGRDLLAQAQTGSGKTAAFAIGLLNRLDALAYATQALVLCPTRELADQVTAEIRRLASAIPNIKILTLCGGKPMGAQLASLQRDPHIVVGTPGRILKHLDKGSLQLGTLQTLVLDEADRMLDMGFHDDIMAIIDQTSPQRQTLLFSATYPAGIKAVSAAVQSNTVEVRVDGPDTGPEIEQVFYRLEGMDRAEALYRVIGHYQPESCLVFCSTRQQCQELAEALRQHDLHALALHGDLEQVERDQVFTQFSSRCSTLLIATDVAARGLDIKELALVVNVELSRDPEVHIHRIGRTGRAGCKGLAVSLVSAAEHGRLQAITELQGCEVELQSLPDDQAARGFKLYPPMVCFSISGGRKQKLRAGDLLGALTATAELSGTQIGKITLFDNCAYVAVEQKVARQALAILESGKIKGRRFRVRRLR